MYMHFLLIFLIKTQTKMEEILTSTQITTFTYTGGNTFSVKGIFDGDDIYHVFFGKLNGLCCVSNGKESSIYINLENSESPVCLSTDLNFEECQSQIDQFMKGYSSNSPTKLTGKIFNDSDDSESPHPQRDNRNVLDPIMEL